MGQGARPVKAVASCGECRRLGRCLIFGAPRAAAILIMLLLAGCQSPADKSEAAAEYVTAYLSGG